MQMESSCARVVKPYNEANLATRPATATVAASAPLTSALARNAAFM